MAAASAANRLVTADVGRLGVRGATFVADDIVVSSSSSSSAASPHLLGETGKEAIASLRMSLVDDVFAFLLLTGGVAVSLRAEVDDAAAAAGDARAGAAPSTSSMSICDDEDEVGEAATTGGADVFSSSSSSLVVVV